VSGSSQHLTIFEDRCDRCGACRSVCSRNALKVGAAYVYVDWRKCEGCLSCVEVCDRNAIVSRIVPLRSSSVKSTVAVADVNKVVVGSRAEAKAVRRAAERAVKEKGNDRAPKKKGPIRIDEKQEIASRSPEKPVVALRPPEKRAVASRSPDKPKIAFRRAEKPIRVARKTTRQTQWTLLDAGAVLAIMIVALLAKNVVLALREVSLMPQLGKLVVRVVVLSAFYVVQIAAFGWVAGRRGLRAAEGFGLRRDVDSRGEDTPSALGSIGLVCALFVGCEAVSIGYGFVMRAAGIMPPERLSSDLAGVFGGGPVGFALAFALVAIAAPFAEEIAFRGIVLPVLGEKWGMWVGIGATALLYAAYHANWWLFAPAAVLGMALGWLAWTRESLWPAIWLHVLYNAVAVIAAFATAK